MEAIDDIDEDELALAMSTELTKPVRSIPIRRTRSFTSFGTAVLVDDLSISSPPRQTTLSPGPQDPRSTAMRSKLIRIQDKSTELADKGGSDGLWASSVTVTDPSIVRGTGKQGISAATGYVVWLCTVETFEGRTLKTRKRYSDFFTLRQNLCAALPKYAVSIPPLPPKSVVSRFRPAFLEKRRRGLELFLSTVLLMPQVGASPIVKKWWFV